MCESNGGSLYRVNIFPGGLKGIVYTSLAAAVSPSLPSGLLQLAGLDLLLGGRAGLLERRCTATFFTFVSSRPTKCS